MAAPPRKILLLSLPGMGDTLMFTPVIPVLRNAYPQAEITALTMYDSSYQVLELDPALNRVACFRFMQEGLSATLRYLMHLRNGKFDISLINYPSNRWEYNLVSRFIGAGQRAGHRYRHQSLLSGSWLNTHLVDEDVSRHNVDENLALLDVLGIDPAESGGPYITLSAGDADFADRFWKENGLEEHTVIGMHVWSTELKNMHRKCWPPDRFGRLIDRLYEADDRIRTVIFQGPNDGEAVRRVHAAARHMPVTAAGMTVRQTAAVLARCRLLVSNDSGVMHLGEAVGTPCVGLFGPTDPGKTAPYDRSKHSVVISGDDLECRPCFYYSPRPLSCRLPGHDFRCLTALPVERVEAAVLKHIRSGQ